MPFFRKSENLFSYITNMDELQQTVDSMEYKVKPEERQKRAEFLETFSIPVEKEPEDEEKKQ